jgi:hypothetical protein
MEKVDTLCFNFMLIVCIFCKEHILITQWGLSVAQGPPVSDAHVPRVQDVNWSWFVMKIVLEKLLRVSCI